jgi:protein phosphatase 1 regulatory subunit 16A
LELLVQNGADVNAKTKNGETPYDICEDPELKERIIQLKNELETKKASNPNRLKRSHSQNTRSHSVRRVSIREKSQIAKREAREEARIRHEQESHEDEDEDAKPQSDAKDNESHSSTSLTDHNIIDSSNAVDINNIDFRLKSLDSDSDISTSNTTQQNQSHSSNGKEAIVIRNTGYTDRDNQHFSANNNSTDGQNRGSGPESVKVEIHVTVNTTPNSNFNSGTLSDLKKQRAEKHRNSLSISSSSDSTNRANDSARNSVTNLPNSFNNSSHSITARYSYDAPPSPSVNIKKFRGDASDIVGDTQKKGCCTII